MTPLVQNLVVFVMVAATTVATWKMLTSPQWERQRRRFFRAKVGIVAGGIIAIYAVVGASNYVITPFRSDDGRSFSLLDLAFAKVPLETTYSAPCAKVDLKGRPLLGFHLLGTDALGKDVLRETLRGAGTALFIGTLTSLIYIPIGILLGISAGYFKGRTDDAVQYIYSTVASIPGILLLVAIMIVLGKGLPQMAIALGFTSWIGLCRLLRGEALRQSERQYCEAARSLGQRHGSIIVRHILPNTMHLVFINFVLGFSGIVLAESVLSYIGVGAPIGTASWGAMIDTSRMELSREPKVWWTLVSATSALFILVLSLNLVGDALRKAFDPKAA